MVELLKGIAASDGVAVAKAYLLVQPDLSFKQNNVEDTAAEEKRLDDALAASSAELEKIRDKAAKSLGEEEAQVFDAHLMVLSDPEMIGQIKQHIQDNKVNAESSLKKLQICTSACSRQWMITLICKNVQQISVTLQNV